LEDFREKLTEFLAAQITIVEDSEKASNIMESIEYSELLDEGSFWVTKSYWTVLFEGEKSNELTFCFSSTGKIFPEGELSIISKNK